jgi:NhaP-type Na+/H+ or K+/H+ antiporter
LVFVGTVVVDAEPEAGATILTVVATTVALSVLLHGLSAWPLSNLYANWYQRSQESEEEMIEAIEPEHIPVRSRVTVSRKGMRTP